VFVFECLLRTLEFFFFLFALSVFLLLFRLICEEIEEGFLFNFHLDFLTLLLFLDLLFSGVTSTIPCNLGGFHFIDHTLGFHEHLLFDDSVREILISLKFKGEIESVLGFLRLVEVKSDILEVSKNWSILLGDNGSDLMVQESL
jgi:hypothetical protein